jgi:hypothetical protein
VKCIAVILSQLVCLYMRTMLNHHLTEYLRILGILDAVCSWEFRACIQSIALLFQLILTRLISIHTTCLLHQKCCSTINIKKWNIYISQSCTYWNKLPPVLSSIYCWFLVVSLSWRRLTQVFKGMIWSCFRRLPAICSLHVEQCM